VIPADVLGLKPGQQRYSQLLDEDGGILDDLMVTRPATEAEAGHLYLVVNASTKEADYAHIAARLPDGVALVRGDDLALLALQGPSAEGVLRRLGCRAADLLFMMSGWFEIAGLRCHVSRSGYTGEDGFEISVEAADAVAMWQALLADPEVKPIGLGARDSLRLEAGLCLYGHDIDRTTTPVEAGLAWSIQKRRREEGGFSGRGAGAAGDRRGSGAPARRASPRGPRPRSRGRARHDPGRPRGRDRHLRRLRPERQRAGRNGLRVQGRLGARERAASPGARAADAGQGFAAAVHAASLQEGLGTHDHALHQGPRVHPGRG
jgi:aminomethyltransferase